jgi:hypothetical protein
LNTPADGIHPPGAGQRAREFEIPRIHPGTSIALGRSSVVSTSMRITEAVQLLKGLFLEVPGTQLSAADAARLSGLDRSTCTVVLEALEDARFLARARNGLFVRRTSDSPIPD